MNKIKQLLLDIYYIVSSNLLSLVVSILVTFLLPKKLGVLNYSYYQLYLFYIPYLSFLHFGWPDGIFLRYGGLKYESLDKKNLKGQFYSLLFLQSIITLIYLSYIYLSNGMEPNKEIIILSLSANIILLSMRSFLHSILLMTGRMKEYSNTVIFDRILFLIIVIFLIILGTDNFVWFLIADILVKIGSLSLASYYCKELVNPNKILEAVNLKESYENIRVGINIVFAYISGTAIIGIIRFGIQSYWGVEIFGKVSLSLSVSSMIMVFITAVSSAIFPMLKRMGENRYQETYEVLKSILLPTIFITLLFYFPLNYFLTFWLPDYKESLKFMSIVFPIVVYEAKVNLLTNTYLKALRKEKDIFRVNLTSAIVSGIFTIIFIYIFGNLMLAILGIICLISFRSNYSELVLSKYIKIEVKKNMIIEYLMVGSFMLISWNSPGLVGFFSYLGVLTTYFIFNKNRIKETITFILKEVKQRS